MNNISILTSVSKGWLHMEGGFNFDEHYYLDPLYRQTQDRKIDSFLKECFPDYAIYNLESNLVQPAFWNPDIFYIGGIQPNLIVGACLGADFVYYPDKDMDLINANLLSGLQSVDDFPGPNEILEHPLIQRFDKQLRNLKESHSECTVIPPFFWDTSGRATIHGFITTAQKFYGEEIFLRIYDNPEFVKAFHEWIADVYIALILHFSEIGEIPIRSVHIGECSGTMIRNKHYGEYITPYASRLGRELGPVRLHSCGNSDHLLDKIAMIENLRVLDTGSDTSINLIRKQLGDIQIDIAPPVDLLIDDANKNRIDAWLDQILFENAAGNMTINFHIEPGYSLENCLAIHDGLYERGLIERKR
jgi:hypothetical protein